MRKNFRFVRPLRLPLLLAILLPFSAFASTPSGEQTITDEALLEQASALRAYMNVHERAALLRAEQLIEQGESEIRSGQHMAGRRPSVLTPKEDVRAINTRGQTLIKSGREKVETGKRAALEILRETSIQRQKIRAAAQKKYNTTVKKTTYTNGLVTGLERVLEDTWDAKYRVILFDGIRISDESGTRKADLALHNSAYDTVVDLDSTRFSVTLPIDLEFSATEDDPADFRFRFANQATFRGKSIALLVIELITSQFSDEVLLGIRTIDTKTHRILTSSVFQITDAARVLNAEEADAGAPSEKWIPRAIAVQDEERLIDRLAAAPSGYFFGVEAEANDPVRTLLLQLVLKDTVRQNSELALVDCDFIRRAYLNDPDMAANFAGKANAALLLRSAEAPGAGEDRYYISAWDKTTNRAISIGRLSLEFPE